MAFDYKKEYPEFYLPKQTPKIIEIPEMNFLSVRGSGNPNDENGEYKKSISLLYNIAYTLKMSYKGTHPIPGFFEFVVPPLEGFWFQEGNLSQIDYHNKDLLHFISCIRLPDFITKADFEWAIQEASRKKKEDFSKVEFFTFEEGLCVQCMHIGSYDEEPKILDSMRQYVEESGYIMDYSDKRLHHEIYLSDPRKSSPNRLKTGIRLPIRKGAK